MEPFISYWDLLMTRVDIFLDQQERNLLYSSLHFFAMNNLVNLHNQKMLKSLNYPIVRCVVECSRRT